MPDWLSILLLVLGLFALLLLAAVGYLMWSFGIPPRGLVAMGAAVVYLLSPIDVLPEAVLGPLGLVDDAGVLAAAALFVYKLVAAQRILREGGVDVARLARRRTPSGPDPR